MSARMLSLDELSSARIKAQRTLSGAESALCALRSELLDNITERRRFWFEGIYEGGRAMATKTLLQLDTAILSYTPERRALILKAARAHFLWWRAYMASLRAPKEVQHAA